ncbi:MAG: SDR family NAD(P)-dependent oxidoreductase [Sphingomonadaceae bacterium]|nr:SDR family NAD(P)-dependent oxidoreductase [Sphingomonadaceae bacterium]MCC0011749.1 SDR family NAD(P)-dependent oxidoreductase [Rhodobiaceae bacterium]MCP5384571.1 SDR family NAD(P)-dependent oxidoreductase [Altererythrobacter sp.]
MQVAGKTVLLTGGSAGIGRELALQLNGKGANVVLTGRNQERLDTISGEGFETIAADLSSAAGVDALVAAMGECTINILINNAGQGVDHDFRDAAPDADAADGCIYANFNAPVRLITALLPRLRNAPEAAIVNVTSGLAIAPRAGSPVYCATKAGLRSYTKALRAQLKGENIHVIEALPPVVDTQMTAGRGGNKLSPRECARQIVAAIEHDRSEANVGMVKLLKIVHSISPRLAESVMIRF